MSLREQVEELFEKSGGCDSKDREVFESFKQALNRGEVRAAEREESGEWRVNSWVKRGILVGFRMGARTDTRGDFLHGEPPTLLTALFANHLENLP